ncbi:MAG: hypothetical protein RL291_1775 [Pseudomonadota bacterium]
MTRVKLKRTMRRVYWLLGLVILVALLSKLASHVPELKNTLPGEIAKDIYDLIRDTSLLIATGGVAYITNAFQQRQSFIEALKGEWHDIVRAKSALLTYMHKPAPTHDEYVAAYTRLSETIDNMRVVYKNVGETDGYIGLYPFAPLHDMRRVLQRLDPRNGPMTDEQRKLARDTMLASFYALRDEFLDELDLEPPATSLLPAGARRIKQPGALAWARRLQDIQAKRQQRLRPPRDEHDEVLARLYALEQQKTAPGDGVNGTNGAAVREASPEGSKGAGSDRLRDPGPTRLG